MSRAVDTQRHKVYRAEQRARVLVSTMVLPTEGGIDATPAVIPLERAFGSVQSAQAYCNGITDAEGAPRVTVRVRRGETRSTYHYATREIALAPGWGFRELVVLHELTHHLTHRRWQSHGPQFAARFLALTETYGRSPQLAATLRQCYDDAKVSYRADHRNGLKNLRRIDKLPNDYRWSYVAHHDRWYAPAGYEAVTVLMDNGEGEPIEIRGWVRFGYTFSALDPGHFQLYTWKGGSTTPEPGPTLPVLLLRYVGATYGH